MSISRGLIARTAMTYEDPTPNILHALTGYFSVTGEDMEPITEFVMQADNSGVTNKFVLAGQSANLVAPALAYTGPGDLTAGAVCFYGLRAYSNAQLSGTTNALRIADSGFGNFLTLKILPTGLLDYAALAAWSGPPGNHGTAYVVDWYDQTGSGATLSQGSIAACPVLTISPPGLTAGRAALTFDATVPRQLSGTISPSVSAQPCTLSVVCNRTAMTAGFRSGVAQGAAASTRFGFENGTNTFFLFAGGGLNPFGTSANNTWYATQSLFSGASSLINIASVASPSGVNTAPSNIGTSAFGGALAVGVSGGGDAFTGYITEIAGWNGSVSSSMGANQIASL
jgi:hypothetical protein